jgi:hypothetical protein
MNTKIKVSPFLAAQARIIIDMNSCPPDVQLAAITIDSCYLNDIDCSVAIINKVKLYRIKPANALGSSVTPTCQS